LIPTVTAVFVRHEAEASDYMDGFAEKLPFPKGFSFPLALAAGAVEK